MNKRNKPDYEDYLERSPNAFQKSKIVARTPPNQKRNEPTEEEKMDVIKNMLMEIKGDIKDMKETITQNNEEVKTLRTQIEIMQNEWRAEKKELTDKLSKAEQRIEKLEKDKIRNNLVVTGIKITAENEKNLCEVIEGMLKKELNLNMKVKEAYKIGEKRCIIETKCWEEKCKILKEKKKLKGQDIFIESAMTAKERDTQNIIRKIAKAEREKGASVKVKFHKLEIDGKTMIWDRADQKLTDSRNYPPPKNY